MIKSSDLPNLDLLRACAVLMVLFDHTFQAVVHPNSTIAWIGRLGVLFFFVHTSFVLMLSLEREWHAKKSLANNFYIRRAFRIYPLSVVAVLAAWIGPRAPAMEIGGWMSNLALTQNLTYSKYAFGSIWSLPLEVQMYILLPALFILAIRTRTLIPLITIWVCTVAIAQSHIYLSNRLSLFKYMPCFIPGVIAYWLFSRNIPKLRAWIWPIALGAIIAGFEVHPNWYFSAWFTCLTLGLVMPFFTQISHKHFNRITLAIAKYSYGIYLGHSLLLMWMRPTYRTLPLYLLLVALIAWLGYRYVEHPLIQYGKRFALRFDSVKSQRSDPKALKI